ncbi:MAG: ferritin family protein [Candidatus Omnitrophota bacterium]
MKNLQKILIVAAFFFWAGAFCAYAEEMKTAETVQTATATIPGAPSAPQAAVEKTTLDNLQTAFNGESNANARYLAFAQKSDAEGYGKAASLFRAAARAEQVHFERHAKAIKELEGVPAATIETPIVKSTAENLKAAMDGEIYESTVMYPGFLTKAEKDGIKSASDAFEDAGKAEAVHANLYKNALENLRGWKGKNKDFYVCPFCGNVVEKANFQACPLCGESKMKFMAVK